MSDKKKRTYQADTLGLPPLKMVLVHAENERAHTAAQSLSPTGHTRTKEEKPTEEVVLRIIEHLEKDL
jgi:hypothetical protein